MQNLSELKESLIKWEERKLKSNNNDVVADVNIDIIQWGIQKYNNAGCY